MTPLEQAAEKVRLAQNALNDFVPSETLSGRLEEAQEELYEAAIAAGQPEAAADAADTFRADTGGDLETEEAADPSDASAVIGSASDVSEEDAIAAGLEDEEETASLSALNSAGAETTASPLVS